MTKERKLLKKQLQGNIDKVGWQPILSLGDYPILVYGDGKS